MTGLKPVCEAQLGDSGAFQSGPLVIGSNLYVTTQTTTVAVDAADCTIRWQHIYRADEFLTELAIAKEFGYKIRCFHHALEAYKVADKIAEAAVEGQNRRESSQADQMRGGRYSQPEPDYEQVDESAEEPVA